MTPAGPESGRVYFPELDGLRFVAFLLVFGFHGGMPWLAEVVSLLTLPIFMVARVFGPDVSDRAAILGPEVARAVRTNGWVGVQLFFILSGYLITTLLLREEARYGRVDLRAFWMRRILRIWPLYYLTVFLTFIVMPAIDGRLARPAGSAMIDSHLAWFSAFLGNWSMIRLGTVGDDAVSILWSVCVEEQFYILCPMVVAVLGRRWRLPAVVSMIGLAVAYRSWTASGRPEQLAIQYDTIAQLDTMLSGVALALWLDGRSTPPRMPRFSGLAIVVLVVAILGKSELAHVTRARRTWDFVLIWVAGLGVVAHAVLRDGRLARLLANPRIVWLGRISYGLYMYHEIAFWATRRAGGWASSNVPAFGLTIALAAGSYYGIERPFLRLKRRWTRVPSRPS